MRVCLYTETALPKTGGQEMVVDALARQLMELGHEVVVLAPYPRLPLRPRDRTLPYRVARHLRFYSTRWLVSWYRWWLLLLHRSFPFDVLHCHSIYQPGYIAALCRQRLGVPTVITSHGGDVREGSLRLTKPVIRARMVQALQAADALIAISRFTADGYRRITPQLPRVVTIPNGVDLAPFAAPALRPPDLDAAIRPGEYVLFLGRLKHRKGVDVLLQALTTVPANGQVQVVIAGDGEERQQLEAQAAQLGLLGRVRFAGAVFGSAKAYLLQNALCTVMPSRGWEAFPVVVLESFAAGKPVLAAAAPGLRDLIEQDCNGWLVPEEAPLELGEALTTVFQRRERIQGMAASLHQLAEAHRWRTIAEQHVQLYEELRAGTARARTA